MIFPATDYRSDAVAAVRPIASHGSDEDSFMSKLTQHKLNSELMKCHWRGRSIEHDFNDPKIGLSNNFIKVDQLLEANGSKYRSNICATLRKIVISEIMSK